MSNYILIDDGRGTIPTTRIVAENEEDAVIKAIKGLLEDEYLSVVDICENLGISLNEVTNLKTYE